MFLFLLGVLPVPFGLLWDHRAGWIKRCAYRLFRSWVCVPLLLRLVLSRLIFPCLLCVDGTFTFRAGVSHRFLFLLLVLVSVVAVAVAL